MQTKIKWRHFKSKHWFLVLLENWSKIVAVPLGLGLYVCVYHSSRKKATLDLPAIVRVVDVFPDGHVSL